MKLGRFVEISVAVPDLAQSLLFYERLGMEKLDQSWEPWPWAVLTDGIVTYQFSQNTPGPLVLNYIVSDMRQRVEALERAGVPVRRLERADVPELVAGMHTPSGVEISLLEYPARRIPRPSGVSTCKCGTFMELALPVPDLAAAEKFWSRLGFERRSGSALPYPWATFSDDLITLGLYQTRDFTRPALLYGSSNPPERIQLLEAEGFRFSAEIPSPRSVGRTVLETPDPLLILLEYREGIG
jgi:catechol 2,3-dioxygenase-like lactoylglutathione lyase family enzyme